MPACPVFPASRTFPSGGSFSQLFLLLGRHMLGVSVCPEAAECSAYLPSSQSGMKALA